MTPDGSLCRAFRRAATFLPAARWRVDSRQGTVEPDAVCAVSFDPPMVAITVPKGAFALPGTEFSCLAGESVKLDCRLLETKETGDHVMLFGSVQGVAIRGGASKVKWRGAWFDLQLSYPFLEDAQSLETFLNDWRTGTLPKQRWTHAAHVAVTGYYAFEQASETVFAEMKRGILHFNSCTGVANGPDSGYHETLTRFWSSRITLSVHEASPESRLEAARYAVRLFGEDRDLPKLFYSYDVVRDRRAWSEWIAPDLEPLSEWCGWGGS